jgi:methionyl-tRNA synthetase
MNDAIQIFQMIQEHRFLFFLLIAWSVFWKALALWHSARSTQTIWYIVLCIVNTVGILEIIYLLFFRKKPVGRYLR